MSILVLCNSDSLGIPTINLLKSKGLLKAVAITSKSFRPLSILLKGIGLKNDELFRLDPSDWVSTLKTYLLEYRPDAVWVLTFPWKIPTELLNLPPKGFLNFHFGLLPKYKGTDPIFWQIKNRESEGGITVHRMNEEIDEGPVLLKEPYPILPGETYGIHCSKLGHFTSNIASKVIELTTDDKLKFIEQDSSGFDFIGKPTEKDLRINWQLQTADEIEWLVNASNPKYGGATTSINNMSLAILEVTPVTLEENIAAEPGIIIHADVIYGIIVACIENQFLRINIIRINEGYISGVKLFNMGFVKGHKFN